MKIFLERGCFVLLILTIGIQEHSFITAEIPFGSLGNVLYDPKNISKQFLLVYFSYHLNNKFCSRSEQLE